MSKKAKLWLAALVLIVLVAPALMLLRINRLQRLWSFAASGSILRHGTDQDGNSYLLYDTGQLYKLDKDGRVIDQGEVTLESEEDYWDSMLVGPDQRVFLSAWSSLEVLCLDNKLETLWRTKLSLLDWQRKRFKTEIVKVTANGNVAVETEYALVWLDREGAQLARIDLPGHHPNRSVQIADDGSIYYIMAEDLITSDGKTLKYPDRHGEFLVKLDPNGNELWRSEGDYRVAYTDLRIAPDGDVYVPQEPIRMEVFSPAGQKLWTHLAYIRDYDRAVFSDDIVYIGGTDGLFKLTRGGSVIWNCDEDAYVNRITPLSNGYLCCMEERFILPDNVVQRGHRLFPKVQWPTKISLIVISPQGQLAYRKPVDWENSLVLYALPDGAFLMRTGEGEVTAYKY